MVFGFTGHVGKWCWEWSKRRTYAFKTKDGTKRVRIPRIIISRGVSVARVTGDGDDQDIYKGIGFLTVDVPNGISTAVRDSPLPRQRARRRSESHPASTHRPLSTRHSCSGRRRAATCRNMGQVEQEAGLTERRERRTAKVAQRRFVRPHDAAPPQNAARGIDETVLVVAVARATNVGGEAIQLSLIGLEAPSVSTGDHPRCWGRRRFGPTSSI